MHSNSVVFAIKCANNDINSGFIGDEDSGLLFLLNLPYSLSDMIKEISIKNYKSIVDQIIGFGQFNVVIGANGCGKSNILEAIAIAGLSVSNKLDEDLFALRGIRVTAPQWMKSAFSDNDSVFIEIEAVTDKNQSSKFKIYYDSEVKPSRWIDAVEEKTLRYLQSLDSEVPQTADELLQLIKSAKAKDINVSFTINGPQLHISHKQVNGLKSFVIYSPEESALRSFEPSSTGQLGRNGQGLFPFLKQLSKREGGDLILAEIKQNLEVIDWFDDLDFPQDSLTQDYSVRLHDRYLDDSLEYFDQRSANEAFLYLLFYFTLLISDETPSFFAIDNIESSLNPKLCRRLVTKLIELAKKHNKQVIVTTHSPYVLDALELNDENQSLLVVRRNIDGHTIVNNVLYNKDVTVPLSEAWMKGYIGGLPNNF